MLGERNLKLIFWLCAWAFALVATVEARLGETVQECQGRYGAAVTNLKAIKAAPRQAPERTLSGF
jgi:hypothetical protein